MTEKSSHPIHRILYWLDMSIPSYLINNLWGGSELHFFRNVRLLRADLVAQFITTSAKKIVRIGDGLEGAH